MRLQFHIKDLPSLLAGLIECGREAGLTAIRVSEMELVVEEVLVNIFRHAYSGDKGEIEFMCKADPEAGEVKVFIADKGEPFDIHEAPAPDLKNDLESRSIGGLGIVLVKNMTDQILYSRRNDRNEMTLIFRNNRNDKEKTESVD